MAEKDQFIELRFRRDQLYPELIRARDLADIISKVEEMMTTLIEDALVGPKQEVIVGLASVNPGSVVIRFKSTTQPDLLVKKYTEVSAAIANNQIDHLPAYCASTLRALQDFAVNKTKTEAWLLGPANTEIPLAKIDATTVLDYPTKQYLEGRTDVYGVVMRVGGASPRIALKVTNQRTIYADIEEDFAQLVGKYLYKLVRLTGSAKWDPKDFALVSFAPDAVVPFAASPISETNAQLSKLIGKYL